MADEFTSVNLDELSDDDLFEYELATALSFREIREERLRRQGELEEEK